MNSLDQRAQVGHEFETAMRDPVWTREVLVLSGHDRAIVIFGRHHDLASPFMRPELLRHIRESLPCTFKNLATPPHERGR